MSASNPVSGSNSVEEITLPPLNPEGAEFFIWKDALDDLLAGDPEESFLRLRSDILEMYPESKKATNEINEPAPRNWYVFLPPETHEEAFAQSRGVELFKNSFDAQMKRGGGFNEEKFWWWILKAQRREPSGDVAKIPIMLSPSPIAHKSDGRGIWWLVSLKPASSYERDVLKALSDIPDVDYEDALLPENTGKFRPGKS